jgi:hypothetical protein
VRIKDPILRHLVAGQIPLGVDFIPISSYFLPFFSPHIRLGSNADAVPPLQLAQTPPTQTLLIPLMGRNKWETQTFAALNRRWGSFPVKLPI